MTSALHHKHAYTQAHTTYPYGHIYTALCLHIHMFAYMDIWISQRAKSHCAMLSCMSSIVSRVQPLGYQLYLYLHMMMANHNNNNEYVFAYIFMCVCMFAGYVSPSFAPARHDM